MGKKRDLASHFTMEVCRESLNNSVSISLKEIAALRRHSADTKGVLVTVMT